LLQNRYRSVTGSLAASETMRVVNAVRSTFLLGLALALPAGCGGVAAHPKAHAPVRPAPAPSFAEPVSYETGRDPAALAIADVNGDGVGDIVSANGASTSVLLNRGKTFARRDYPGGGVAVAIGDLNLDGGPDVVVIDEKTASVLLNRGNGTFRAGHDYATGKYTAALALADLDGDGGLDLAIANGEGVSVLLNLGDGSFARRVDYRAGDGPMSIAIADFNEDGKPDLATASSEGSSVRLLNQGKGTFGRAHSYASTSGGSLLVADDFNGDETPDLAVAENDESGDFSDEEGGPTLYPSWVSVYSNRSAATGLHEKGYVQTSGYGEGISALAASDVNGDGRADAVFAHWLDGGGSAISALLSSGDSAFGEEIDYPADQDWEFALAVGDLNGDARPDLVTASVSSAAGVSHSVSVFVNTPGLCTVQDVSGMALAHPVRLAAARRALERAHCRVGAIREIVDEDDPEGLVFDQKPRFGAVLPAGAKVDLVVSKAQK
jgi:FG-GAP-like repeat/PASTA domain